MTQGMEAVLRSMGMAEPDIGPFLGRFKIAYFEKNQNLVSVADSEVPVVFVNSGVFVESVTDSDGREFIHSFYGPGGFVSCMFRWGRRSQSNIVCLKKACVSVFDGKPDELPVLFSQLTGNGGVGMIDESVNRCLLEVHARLEEFATLDAADRYRIFKDRYASLENEIPLHLTAAYIGVTPTQLSRIRNKI